MRPSSEVTRRGTVAGTTASVRSGSPARRRSTGATNVVEGEHRRGREARQDHDRLAVADGEAERLAGLQRDAVGDDARRAQARDDADR